MMGSMFRSMLACDVEQESDLEDAGKDGSMAPAIDSTRPVATPARAPTTQEATMPGDPIAQPESERPAMSKYEKVVTRQDSFA